jgi:hypothetical protein
MRSISLLLIVATIILLSACRSDFETVASSGRLEFSKDTIFLDTTSTYALKVYNRSNDDIHIPTINLRKRTNSKYRMTVDGSSGNQGKEFKNITLLAKDSLYIFIEATASITDASTKDFLYTDQIEFDAGSNLQKVELVTLIQDAVFLYPKKTATSTETITIDGKAEKGFFLDKNDPTNGNELHFTNKKAYVIYGQAAVPENETLIIDPGSRVYFHLNSGLIVSKNASLQINGTASATKKLEGEVIFEGDRIEPLFDNIPGQWSAVWFLKGSKNNSINHLTLKNASIGLLVENNAETTFSLKNTQIYNCTNYGLQAKNTKIVAENLVINNCGLASLNCTYGGDYTFTHSTFYNNWSTSSPVAVSIDNYTLGATPEVNALTQATFNNCIIYGSNSNQLALNKKEGAAFEYAFNNCLIRYPETSTNALYQFATDAVHYKQIILNKDPKFYNQGLNDFNIDKTSSAFAKGNIIYLVAKDITGTTRTSPPDLGAYQSKDFPKK